MNRWQWLGFLIAVGCWSYIVGSCKSDGGGGVTPEPIDPPYQGTPYSWKKPANFPDPVYDFVNNPLTVQGVQLGKALFYDALCRKMVQ